MKLHFDPNQQFQLDAIKSVLALFEGQPLNKGDYEFSLASDSSRLQFGANGIGNNLILSEEQILKNLQEVQKINNLPLSEKLEGLNFSLEMETGTGKTYVYLRTVYELNKLYGFKKFIIVVPSIAIREGALKNLEITEEHFQNLYSRVPATYQVYDSGRISNLRSFAQSNTIQILVMNIDSFAKDENIINKLNDKLTGRKPIEFIQSVKPIVIVDEPQNMETEIRKKALANLNPTCTLRYSATHTNLYNLVYSLDPVRAYDMGLVKQIEVDSVFTEHDFNRAYIALRDLKSSKTKTAAKITIDCETDNGVARKTITAGVGDDLYEKSNKREIYKDGYVINRIDIRDGCIELSNGDVIQKGESRGGLTDEVMKVQMEKALEEHLRKEKKYKDRGVKVLSLFFIDRVANYRTAEGAKGKFAVWFEEIYKKYAQKPIFAGLIPFEAEQVHNGYFAQDKKGHLRDSSESRETQADDEVYHLIMKDKERLLGMSEPLRFIFSHSALREGWDNPNVFQICTLNETKSELKKRQEIGRGMRLCVDKNGDRIFDKDVNRLTIIANESYEDFASKLQKEIEDDCGVLFAGRIKDARKRVAVKLRKGFELDKKFIDLWDKIKQRTTYSVSYSTDELIKIASKSLKDMPEIKMPLVKSVKTAMSIIREGIDGSQISSDVHYFDSALMEIPDILGYIQEKTELTRSSIRRILMESGRVGDVLKNPQLFLDMAISVIKRVLNDILVDGIKYEKIGGQEYEMMLFKSSEIESYIGNLYKVSKEQKTIANYIETLSEPERKFAQDCESREDVEFYIKLPHWFKIKTPLGDYNPDWALIFKNEKTLYFVAETKSTTDTQKLRPTENLKIKCGASHFKEFDTVTFKQVTKVEELI